MNCGFSGYPSENGGLRLYSFTECDALGGLWHANGECTRPEGGSISLDCKAVNDDPLDTAMRMVMKYKWFIGGAMLTTGLNNGKNCPHSAGL